MSDIIQFSHFLEFPNLVHGFSTRKLGSIKEHGIVFEDHLEVFAKELGIDAKKVIFTRQVHGNNVVIVSQESERYIPDADGLITKDKQNFLGIGTADCLPIIFFDPIKEAVGIVHAGYKGLLRDVISHELGTLRQLGSDMKNVLVGIGPAIDVCCYDVHKDRVAIFKKKFPFLQNYYLRKEDKYFLDLKHIASEILQHEGILDSHIAISSFCTASSIDTFFSFRGEGFKKNGLFGTIIGMI